MAAASRDAGPRGDRGDDPRRAGGHAHARSRRHRVGAATLRRRHSRAHVPAVEPDGRQLRAAGARSRRMPLLDSAVARNLAIAQGTTREWRRRETPAVPQAPAPERAGDRTLRWRRPSSGWRRGGRRRRRSRTRAGVAADRLRVRGAAARRGVAAPRHERGNADAAGSPADAQGGRLMSGTLSPRCRRDTPMLAPERASVWRARRAARRGATSRCRSSCVVDSGPARGDADARPCGRGRPGRRPRAVWTRSADGQRHAHAAARRPDTGTIALGPDAGGRAGMASSGAIARRARWPSAARRRAAIARRRDAGARRPLPRPQRAGAWRRRRAAPAARDARLPDALSSQRADAARRAQPRGR